MARKILTNASNLLDLIEHAPVAVLRRLIELSHGSQQHEPKEKAA